MKRVCGSLVVGERDGWAERGGVACLKRRSGHGERGSGEPGEEAWYWVGVFFLSIYGLMSILLSEKSNLITSAEPLWQRFMQREGGWDKQQECWGWTLGAVNPMQLTLLIY